MVNKVGSTSKIQEYHNTPYQRVYGESKFTELKALLLAAYTKTIWYEDYANPKNIPSGNRLKVNVTKQLLNSFEHKEYTKMEIAKTLNELFNLKDTDF